VFRTALRQTHRNARREAIVVTYHRTRKRRIAQGLCGSCGAPRGIDGTDKSCRRCLAKTAGGRRPPNGTIRVEGGYAILKCENCFKEFPWEGRGQRVFCDACIPWFADKGLSAVDHEAEQEQARKVKHVWAYTVLERWQKEA